MKKSMFLAIVMGLFIISTAIAQEPGDTLWTRSYGGALADKSESVRQTDDGGYIVTGWTSSFGAGGYDAWLVKTDANGDTLWTGTYGGTQTDVGMSVQQTGDGGYIIAGYSESFSVSWYDAYLVKTDANGDTLWTKTYGWDYNDYGEAIQQTGDGGYIIAGSTESLETSLDFLLLKTDANGDTLWTRTYGGSLFDGAYSVQVTSDGGYIIVGRTQSFGAGWFDFYLVKTDADGDTLWTQTYGGSEMDYAYSVQQTGDGGYIIAGATHSFGAGNGDVWLIKTDANGDTEWTRTYGGLEEDVANSVQQTEDGGYIIAGKTASFGAGNSDVWVLKTDANGDTLWTRTYGGTSSDVAQSVQQTTDGGYVMAGYTKSFGAGNYDVWLLKIAGEAPVSMHCETLSPVFCRGGRFNFAITVTNNSGGSVSGDLDFIGYSAYDCDPLNTLVTLSRAKTYPAGTTTEYYYYKVPNVVEPGQHSASVGGNLGGLDLFCCMNADIIQCAPWRVGDNTEWELVETDRPEVALPTVTELYQNYPNPFNAQTNIGFSVAAAGNVTLKVYDIGGRLVATLMDGHQECGEHVVTWDDSEAASGVYFYKLTAGDFTEVKRMTLLR